MSLYSKLDIFLSNENWYGTHPFDEERYYLALSQIVHHPDFNADSMGEYIRKIKNISRDDDDGYFSKAVDRLVSNAWAVRDYFKYTKSLDN